MISVAKARPLKSVLSAPKVSPNVPKLVSPAFLILHSNLSVKYDKHQGNIIQISTMTIIEKAIAHVSIFFFRF